MATQSKAQLPPSPQFQLSFLQERTSLHLPKVEDALPGQHPGPDPITELMMNSDLSFFLFLPSKARSSLMSKTVLIMFFFYIPHT